MRHILSGAKHGAGGRCDSRDGQEPGLLRTLAYLESFHSSLDGRLADLVFCATRATFTVMLQRAIALPDNELTDLVSALRSCGMIADETGHLLPALFYQMHRELFIENDNPVQFARLHAVFAFPDVDACIHGHSIRGDALQALAELVRANAIEDAVMVRQCLAAQFDPHVYRRLVNECGSFRTFVKRVEQTSEHPLPGSWQWTYFYYEPTAVFESLGREAMNSAESPGADENKMGTDFEPTQPDRKGYVVRATMLSLFCVFAILGAPLVLGDSNRWGPLDTLFLILNYVVAVPLALLAIPRCLDGLRVLPYIRLTPTGIELRLWRAGAVDHLLPFRRSVEIAIPWEEFVDCRVRVEGGNPLASSYVIIQRRRRQYRCDDEIRVYERLFRTSASDLMAAILNYAAINAPATAQGERSAKTAEPPATRRAGWGEEDLGSAPADRPTAARARTAEPKGELPEPLEVRVPVKKAGLPLVVIGVILVSLGLASSLIYGIGSVPSVVACLPIALIGSVLVLIGYTMVKTPWENRKRCRLQLRADGLVVKSSSDEETLYPWSEIALTRIIRTEEQSVFKHVSFRWQIVFRSGGVLEIPDIYNRSLKELQDLVPRYFAMH